MHNRDKDQSAMIIRGLRLNDWEDIAAIFALPKCQRQTMQLPYRSADLQKERVERQVREEHGLVAVIDDKVVGMANLKRDKGRRSHAGYFGIAVHDDYQGKGVGSALIAAIVDLADNWLDLRRIELTVYCDNERAISLYQKFGFEIEGTLKKFAFRDGELTDAYSMARVR